MTEPQKSFKELPEGAVLEPPKSFKELPEGALLESPKSFKELPEGAVLEDDLSIDEIKKMQSEGVELSEKLQRKLFDADDERSLLDKVSGVAGAVIPTLVDTTVDFISGGLQLANKAALQPLLLSVGDTRENSEKAQKVFKERDEALRSAVIGVSRDVEETANAAVRAIYFGTGATDKFLGKSKEERFRAWQDRQVMRDQEAQSVAENPDRTNYLLSQNPLIQAYVENEAEKMGLPPEEVEKVKQDYIQSMLDSGLTKDQINEQIATFGEFRSPLSLPGVGLAGKFASKTVGKALSKVTAPIAKKIGNLPARAIGAVAGGTEFSANKVLQGTEFTQTVAKNIGQYAINDPDTWIKGTVNTAILPVVAVAKPVAGIARVVKDIARQVDVGGTAGRRGILERTGDDALSGKGAKGAFGPESKGGVARAKVGDWMIRQANAVIQPSVNAAALNVVMGLPDIETAEDLGSVIGTGLGVGAIGGSRIEERLTGLIDPRTTMAEKITNLVTPDPAAYRRDEDADIKRFMAQASPEIQKNIADLSNIETRKTAIDATIANLEKKRDSQINPDDAAFDQIQIDGFLKQKEALSKATPETQAETTRQTALAFIDAYDLAQSTGGVAGLRGVNIAVLDPANADQFFRNLYGDSLNQAETTVNLLTGIPSLTETDSTKLTEARQLLQRFQTDVEGAKSVRGFAIQEDNTDPNSKNFVPPHLRRINQQGATAVINADLIKHMTSQGLNLRHTLQHEVQHAVQQFSEVNKMLAPLRGQLFDQKIKNDDGTTEVYQQGIYSDEDLDRYATRYAKLMSPSDDGASFYAQFGGEVEKMRAYIKDEILAETAAATGEYAGGTRAALDDVGRNVMDWLEVKTKSGRLKQLKEALRRNGVIFDNVGATSSVLNSQMSPETLAMMRQYQRGLKDFDGTMTVQQSRESDEPDIPLTKILGSVALQNKYRHADFFEKEQIIKATAPDGSVTEIVVPAGAKIDPFIDVYRTQGGQLVDADGNVVTLGPEITFGSMPDGTKFETDTRIARKSNGSPMILTNREMKARARKRTEIIQIAIDSAKDDGSGVRLSDTGNGNYRGVMSPTQIEAFMLLPNEVVSPNLKRMTKFFNTLMAKNDGTRVVMEYQAALLNGKYKALSPKIRDEVPIGFQLTKDGNFALTTISVSRLYDKMQAWADKRPSNLQPWNGDTGAFWDSVTKYLDNHAKGEKGETGLHPDAYIAGKMKNKINDLFNAYNAETKQSNPERSTLPRARGKDNLDIVIRSRRLDRINNFEESPSQKLPINYGYLTTNYMPAVNPMAAPMTAEEVQNRFDGSVTATRVRRAMATGEVDALESELRQMDDLLPTESLQLVQAEGEMPRIQIVSMFDPENVASLEPEEIVSDIDAETEAELAILDAQDGTVPPQDIAQVLSSKLDQLYADGGRSPIIPALESELEKINQQLALQFMPAENEMMPSKGKIIFEEGVKDSQGNGQYVDRIYGTEGNIEWDSNEDLFPRIRWSQTIKEGAGKTLYLEALSKVKSLGKKGLKSDPVADDDEDTGGPTERAIGAQKSLEIRGLITITNAKDGSRLLEITPKGEAFLQTASPDIRFMPAESKITKIENIPNTRILNKSIKTVNGSRYYNIVKDGEWYSIRISDHPQKSSQYLVTESIGMPRMSKLANIGMDRPHDINIVIDEPVKTESQAAEIINKVLNELPKKSIYRLESKDKNGNTLVLGNDTILIDGRFDRWEISYEDQDGKSFDEVKLITAPEAQGQLQFMPAEAPSGERGFQSKLQTEIQRKFRGANATPEQLKAVLGNPQNVKAEEVKWSGVMDEIDRLAQENKGKVPVQELLNYLRDEGQIKFNEVTLGENNNIKNVADQYKIRVEGEYGETAFYDEFDDPLEFDELPFALQDAINNSKKQPKFAEYQLPGGENYREVVMTMPNPPTIRKKYGVEIDMDVFGTEWRYKLGIDFDSEKDAVKFIKDRHSDSKNPRVISWEFEEPTKPDYTSTHFPDIPNYIAHMRLNERTDAEGNQGLFVEEFQSDRHQAGREKGYREELVPEFELLRDGIFEDHFKTKEDAEYELKKREQIFPERKGKYSIQESNVFKAQAGIPDAPFRKDWGVQLFKRALRDAVESGKSWIGWTTGDTQAERYKLSKQVDSIVVILDGENTYALTAYKDGRSQVNEEKIPEAKLSEFIGKELANQAIGQIKSSEQPSLASAEFEGLDLDVGGEGMQGFYDTILPKEIGKYVAKMGGKVEKSEISAGKKYNFELFNPQGEPKSVFVLRDQITGKFLADSEKETFSSRAEDGELMSQKAAESIVEAFAKDTDTPIWKVNITPEMANVVRTGQLQFMPAVSDAEYLELAKDPEANQERLQRMVDDAERLEAESNFERKYGSKIFGEYPQASKVFKRLDGTLKNNIPLPVAMLQSGLNGNKYYVRALMVTDDNGVNYGFYNDRKGRTQVIRNSRENFGVWDDPAARNSYLTIAEFIAKRAKYPAINAKFKDFAIDWWSTQGDIKSTAKLKDFIEWEFLDDEIGEVQVRIGTPTTGWKKAVTKAEYQHLPVAKFKDRTEIIINTGDKELFKNPSDLFASLIHEAVHLIQAKEGRLYKSLQGDANYYSNDIEKEAKDASATIPLLDWAENNLGDYIPGKSDINHPHSLPPAASAVITDDAGNVIPLSQRFQTTSPDTRFMPAENTAALSDLPAPEAQQSVEKPLGMVSLPNVPVRPKKPTPVERTMQADAGDFSIVIGGKPGKYGFGYTTVADLTPELELSEQRKKYLLEALTPRNDELNKKRDALLEVGNLFWKKVDIYKQEKKSNEDIKKLAEIDNFFKEFLKKTDKEFSLGDAIQVAEVDRLTKLINLTNRGMVPAPFKFPVDNRAVPAPVEKPADINPKASKEDKAKYAKEIAAYDKYTALLKQREQDASIGLKSLQGAVATLFKTKKFKEFIVDAVGLSDIQFDNILGTWKFEPEPSFVFSAKGMTWEQARSVTKWLSVLMTQDVGIAWKPSIGLTEGAPSVYLVHDKKLTDEQILNAFKKAKEVGIDGLSVTVDGKGIKAANFDGIDKFEDKLIEIQKASNIKNINKTLVDSFYYDTTSDFTADDGSLKVPDWIKGESINEENTQDQQGGISEAIQQDTRFASGFPILLRRGIDSVLVPYAKSLAGEGFTFDPDRFAARYGLGQEVADYIREQLYPTTGLSRSVTPILDGTEKFTVPESYYTKGGRLKTSVNDLMSGLQKRSADDGFIQPGDYSTRAGQIVAETIVDEIEGHMERAAKNPEAPNAIGWYDTALKKMKQKYSEFFPFLNRGTPTYDADKEFVFDCVLGIASQGNNVFENGKMAARVQFLLESGKTLPEIKDVLYGTFGGETRAIENNLLKLDELIKKNGIQALDKLFRKKMTVSEWNSYFKKNKNLWFKGKPLTVDGKSDQMVTGFSVFGPKIGSFINNLHGDYSTLTADLWFTRTWNRILGNVFQHAPLKEANQFNSFRKAILEQYRSDSAQSAGEKFEPLLKRTTKEGEKEFFDYMQEAELTGISRSNLDKLLSDPQKMLELATALEDRYRKGQYKAKSDLRRTAKNWVENRTDPVAAPRTDLERDFQQNVMEIAQKKLRRKGINITIADMHAALWYNEKELFGLYGAQVSGSEPADYADAADNADEIMAYASLFKVSRLVDVGGKLRTEIVRILTPEQEVALTGVKNAKTPEEYVAVLAARKKAEDDENAAEKKLEEAELKAAKLARELATATDEKSKEKLKASLEKAKKTLSDLTGGTKETLPDLTGENKE